jgi:hypothetical protein
MVVAVVVYTFSDPTFLGADFRAFYTGGTFVRIGRSELLYDVGAAAQFQADRLGATGVSAWLSPPYLAWLFAPLSRLPFFAALAVETTVGIAFGAAALGLLARELGEKRPSMVWVVASYYPTLQWLVDGQLTSLWVLVFVAVFVFLRRGNDAAAGAALGCLALKPPLAIGLLAMLVGARRVRALVAAAFSAGVWIAIGYVTLPHAMQAYVDYLVELGAFLRSDGYPTAGLHGLWQVGHLLLDAVSVRIATAIGAILTALALSAIAVLWARSPWDPKSAPWDRRMAATLVLATLASPHLFGYDLMLLLVPFFIVWRLYPDGTFGRPLDGGPLLGTTAVLWAFALVGPALTVVQQAFFAWAFHKTAALQLGVPIALFWAWLVVRPRLDVDRRRARMPC